MVQKYVLVLWTKTKQTSVVPQEKFVKSFGATRNEIPITEGAVRIVTIGDHRYEAEVLRISASQKYLESLLVTKEGKILLHGTKPSCDVILAKRSKLLNDGPEGRQKERDILRKLTSNAEEQQPNTRLDSSKCLNGCPSCCSGTLPPFPTIPEGFVSTVVSLAEYFHQFHKSTIANIIAAGHVLSPAEPEPWMVTADDKVELKKDSGVWVKRIALKRILSQVDSMKKAPHQTLVKSLLTHLLGVDKYIDTPAEKMDCRLMSAVVDFVNYSYPDGAQQSDRYYKYVNINRSYLLRRRNEGAFEDPYVLKQYNAGIGRVDGFRKPQTLFSGTEEERKKLFNESGAKKVRKSDSLVMNGPSNSLNVHNNLGEGSVTIPFNGQMVEGIPITSPNNANKIVVVRKPVTNMLLSNSDINPRSSMTVPSNFQSAVLVSTSNPLNGLPSNNAFVISSNRPSIPPNFTNLNSQSQIFNSANRPIGSFQPLPPVNQSNQLIPSGISANPAVQPNATSTGKRTFIPTNRLLVSTPSRLSPANPQIVLSSKPRSVTSEVTVSSSSPHLSVLKSQPIKNIAFKSTPLPTGALSEIPVASLSQPNRHSSQPVKLINYKIVRKVSSPEIIEIPSDGENVEFTTIPSVKREDNFEIEGALDFPL